MERLQHQQDSNESINTLRKILERRKINNIGVLEKPDGKYTNPRYQSLEFLMKSHFPSITAPQVIEHKNKKSALLL